MPEALVEPFESDRLLHRATRLLELRRLRSHYLPPCLFGEPGWDMLIATWIAAREGRVQYVKSLVARAGAPATTAQRWIEQLDRLGLVTRATDPADRRRIEVSLTVAGEQAVDGYLRALAGSRGGASGPDRR